MLDGVERGRSTETGESKGLVVEVEEVVEGIEDLQEGDNGDNGDDSVSWDLHESDLIESTFF